MACVVYQKSTENLKSYMQRQWNCGWNGWNVQGDGMTEGMVLYNFGKLHTKHKKVWYDAQSTEVFPCKIF